ncbi:MAG TPA: DNA polymerase III subunit gamma/tau [Acidobacteriaceae bacterium]|jgi:DNA polymerase-3 subunit gamma/tau|nr:DNA polymerase III subunit gamma/tau [Acidobacteriaceae bacterium]
MAYQVLARKYRPQRFADVAGQEHVTRTLLNALEQGRVAHGYIFSGHRGIGKTTIARILAQALNCRTPSGTPERPTLEPCGVCDSCQEIRAGNAVDVLEIDAATNRGIDEVRELREAARYRPARDKYKIWILDEAHQITDAAFNALLKTLEEPPEHVIFMMATTQPEDIPQTIRSRCQHFSFHAVKFDDILTQLQTIAAQEEIEADDAALALLAEAGDGSMRDALSIMDQAIASAPLVNGKAHLVADQIRELMGSVPNTVFERLLEAISAGQTAAVIAELNTLLNAGNSPAALGRQFVRYLRNALMARIGGENTDLLQISADERARASRSAMLFSEEDLTRFLQVMLRTFDELNYRQEQRFHLELGLVKLVHLQRLLPVEQLLSQLPGSGGSSNAPASGSGTGSRSVAAVPRSAAASTPQTQPAPERSAPAPRPSPFEADRDRKIVGSAGEGSGSAPRALSPFESASRAADTAPPVFESKPVAAVGLAEPLAAVTDGSLALAAGAEAGTVVAEAPDLDRIRDAVCAALAQAGHETAANLIHQGKWTDQGNTIQVELAVRKTMLSLTVNAEAEAICRKTMRAMGAMQKIAFLPGENGNGATTGPARQNAPLTGSAQSAALENPLVRRTQELFKAEIRSVLDLRETH